MKKKLILIFCVLTGLAWVGAINEAVERPKLLMEHLEKAAEYESQEIYVDAVTEYENALQYAPGDVEITYKMANAHLQLGNAKKYMDICKGLIEKYPERGDILDNLVTYYLEKRDKSTAVKYVAELVKKYPKNECAQKWLIELKGSYTEIYFSYKDLAGGYNDNFIVAIKDEETDKVYYGVTDALGEEILLTEYESAQPFSRDGYALVEKNGQTLYLDRDGHTRKVPDMTLYESVSMMNNERVVACQGGKYGLLDDTLKPKTEFIYEDITLPNDNLAMAKQGGKWALIGRNGKEKTEYIYDEVIRDQYGIASRQKLIFAQENGVYYIINNKGEKVGELGFESAKPFPTEGYAAVCQNGKWGFVNVSGELVIDYQFEDAKSFSNGYAAVCQDGKWGFVDIAGVTVIPIEFEDVTNITSSGTAAVKKDKWGLIQINLFR